MKRVLAIAFALASISVASTSGKGGSADWREFRQRYPYHIQTIALSNPAETGARTLIVSEPPPGVSIASIAKTDPLLARPVVMKHRVGTDGWVKDLVYEIPPVAPHQLAALVDRLSVELFSTSYKAHALNIGDDGANRPVRLDYQITASQLNEWASSREEAFHAASATTERTIRQLIDAGRPGVFYSSRPGMIAWVVPRRGDLSVFRRDARQFALDSDLIVGAVRGLTHLAIVARERQVSIDLLPPLRTETVFLLADVGEDDLAQSYDRFDFGAGKLVDNQDWAPIYLSEALIDTEYGSLLNITDQLLKSWTSVGRVSYAGFSYPRPSRFPIDQPLYDLLKAPTLTYNWNTRGAGYLVESENAQIFALNRTGALSVSYLPEGVVSKQREATAKYEDLFYDFFAQVGDPNLARVVQYAALFQIFRHARITTPSSRVSVSRRHPEMEALVTLTQRALQNFLNADDAGLQNLAANAGYKLSETGLNRLRLAQASVSEYRRRDLNLSVLAETLANPRGGAFSWDAQQLGVQLRPVAEFLLPPDDAMDVYQQAAARESNRWIQTPSYVLSTSWRPEGITGGHNLDARVTQFEIRADVPKGTVAIRANPRGERVVTLNPADAPRIGDAVRVAAREDPALVKSRVEQVLRTTRAPVLPRDQALGLAPNLGTAAHIGVDRGFVQRQIGQTGYRGGWSLSGTQAPAEYRTAAAGSGGHFFVDRNPDYTYRVTVPGSNGTYVARSYDSAVDLVAQSIRSREAGAESVTLFFTDVDKAEAGNFLRSVEVRSSAGARAKAPAGFGRSRLGAIEDLRVALARKYDFRAARITESATERLASGGEQLRLTLEVPALEAARRPLLVRVILFFTDRISAAARRSVETIVDRILRQRAPALAALPLRGDEILGAIKADLRLLHPDIDVDIKIGGAGDFYVAELGGDRRASA